jgi:hypothetical protein
LDITEAAPFMAKALLPLVQVHRTAPRQVQWNLERGILLMVRNLERCVQHRVSVEAANLAREMGLPDLHSLEWRHQPTKMQDKGRKIFHWEHVTQASDIQKEILADPNPDVEKIESSLKRTFLAWILKRENDLLPKGPRKDPFFIYEQKGIRFVPLPLAPDRIDTKPT